MVFRGIIFCIFIELFNRKNVCLPVPKLAVYVAFFVIGIIVELKFKEYVLFGNPMKYMLWFGTGMYADKNVGIFKRFHLCNKCLFLSWR